MTAEVAPLFPTGDRADETVRRTVAALIEGRNLTVDQAAVMAGMTRATLYRRLSGKGSRQAFMAGEVASLARVLRVRIDQLYDGLGGTFVPPDDDPGGGVRHQGLEPRTRWFEAPQRRLSLVGGQAA
jgi:transcriptional regulator with XRE-family HTH domain